MNKSITLLTLAFSLAFMACSSGDSGNRGSSAAKPTKLETAKADATLNQWALSEEKKASELLKMGDNTGGGLDRVRVLVVNENGNTAEASFRFQTMAMFLEGKSVKMIQGFGKAIFEWKDGKWFLTRVTNEQADFVRDNLSVEVK